MNISPAFPLRSPANDDGSLPTTTERLTAPRSSPLIREGGRSSYSRSIGPVPDQEKLQEERDEQEEQLTVMATSYESFIGRTWALVVVSIALFGICLSLWMLVYVFLKMCDGTLSGNQSMGVLLLLGVILMFGSAVPWLLPPSPMICAVRYVMCMTQTEDDEKIVEFLKISFFQNQAFPSPACILPLLWPPPHKGEPESWKSVVDNLLLLYHS